MTDNNEELVQLFKMMRDYRYYQGSTHSGNAYDKAIPHIESHGKISSGEEMTSYGGIGKGIAGKIDDYLETGSTRLVDEIKKDDPEWYKEWMKKNSKERTEIINLFTGIYGVGKITAENWYNEGYETIEDLEEADVLTSSQKKSIKYYDDLQERIPRKLIVTFETIARFIFDRKLGKKNYWMMIAGSYRRKARTSGDIDMLIQSTTYKLKDFVDLLQKCTFLVETLAIKEKKYNGIGHIPGEDLYFRVDMMMTSKERLGAAVMHFTGNYKFNEKTRGIASRAGYRLNEYGLFRVNVLTGNKKKKANPVKVKSESEIFQRLNKQNNEGIFEFKNKGRIKVEKVELIEAESERKIFKILGIKYVKPENRIG